MAADRLKSKVTSAFKMHGLLLRAEASRYLTDVLRSVNEVELEDVIDSIIGAVEKQPLSSNMIEKSAVETAVQECSRSCDETIEHIFNIIGAFDIPRFIYNSERKKFLPLKIANLPEPNLFGGGKDKADLFRERYTILQQRTHRHELFTPPVIGAHPDESRSKFQLKTVENLLGSAAKMGEVIVLGMITQLKEGKYFLEDPTGAVQLDLSKAQFHSGLYTESCFVLAEGWYEDKIFHVNAFGFPPTEPSSTTRIAGEILGAGSLSPLVWPPNLQMVCQHSSPFHSMADFLWPQVSSMQCSQSRRIEGSNTQVDYLILACNKKKRKVMKNVLDNHVEPFRAYYGNMNFFGGPSSTSVKASVKLKQLEEENEDAMFVFLSDLWLDQVEVIEKLHTMFSGYSTAPPTCFIFCGNFSSAPYGKNQIKSLKDSFKNLADVICEYPNIHKSSRFVFVPGPEDPGPGFILPRPPIAEHITEEFRQRVPFSIFTTNPCRIQYCTQEMVIFREDLVNKMCRNCVRFPSSSLDIPSHFVKTILSQGHLTPLPLFVSPVYWAYDYALRLYPLPDLVVIADKYDPFTVTNTECLTINPGSFPKSGFSFKVYYPSSKNAEDSKLQNV